MTDRADAIIVRFEPASGPPERWRFEPRSDGRWVRIEEYWNGCRWAGRGAEFVDNVAVEDPA